MNRGRKRDLIKPVHFKGLVHDIVNPSYQAASLPADCVHIVRRPIEYAGSSLAKVNISCYNVEIMSKLLELISSTSKVVSDLILSLLHGPSDINISRDEYLSMVSNEAQKSHSQDILG